MPPGTARLPLFPLGLVLFPGLLLPLHVFEERYRVLVRDLLDLPEQERRFGVVALREGHEVGQDGARALHDVGCVARVRRVQAYPDGRYDVVTTGAERFRLHGLVHDRPYLVGETTPLDDAPGDPDEALVLRDGVVRAHGGYRQALVAAGADDPGDDEALPTDPTAASWSVAAGVLLDLHERQALLEVPGTVERLAGELRLLRRETTLLTTLGAVPAPELTRVPTVLN